MLSMIVRLAGTHLLQGSAGVSIFRIKRRLHLVAALCLGLVEQFIDFLQPFFKGFRRGLCDGQHSATDRKVLCRSGDVQLDHAFAELCDKRLWLGMAVQDERKFFATKASNNAHAILTSTG